jgi:hypothetical protein
MTWDASSSAPPAIAMALIAREVEGLLFLVQSGPETDSLAANYVAAAHYHLTKQRLALCTGIRLSSNIAPDLWGQIFRSHFIELAPNPSIESIHFVREALGVQEKEYVTLVHLGKGASTQGILVVYSTHSLTTELAALLAADRPSDQPPPLALDLTGPPALNHSDPPKKKRTGKTGLFKRAA